MLFFLISYGRGSGCTGESREGWMDNLVAVRLTVPQLKLIDSIVAIPDDLESSIKQATRKSDGTLYEIPYVALDQLAGWLAAEANHEESARRKSSLERLYDEIQTALWEFDDRRIAAGEPVPVVADTAIARAQSASSGRGKTARRR
jgi:hypothetical protein